MVDAILAAATRVFGERGYARATTNRIAETAGVSVGSVYQYFPSKDAIAVELLKRYRERLVARIGTHVSKMNAVTFKEVVRSLMIALLDDDQIDHGLRRVLIERVVRTDAGREVVGFEERIEQVLADALRASKDLVAVVDHDLCAFILVRTVLAVAHGAMVDRPKRDTAAVAHELTRLIVRYVGRRPPRSLS